MAKKKSAGKKDVAEKVEDAVQHAFESHVAFIQHKTSAWEGIAQAIDKLGELAGDDETSLAKMREGRTGLAYALLQDIESLQTLYEFMFETGLVIHEKVLEADRK